MPDTHEVEIKAKVDDISTFKKTLEDVGCTFSKPLIQKDTIFIPKGITFENLIPGTSVLRLREVNNTVVFTLKQRKKDKEELIKLEEEVIVSNADTMKSIIELLDYAPVVQVNKERISCHHKSFEINIDSVENLGIFVEVESISDGNPDEILKEMLDLLISFGRITFCSVNLVFNTRAAFPV